MKFTAKQIDQWWKSGKTLPVEVTQQYPLDPIKLINDTGINLLVDMSHKCDFFLLWQLSEQLHRRGIRSVGSHATLDTQLVPKSLARIRITIEPKLHPFAWWPTPQWNVVLTEGEFGSPDYIPEERQALERYLRNGGGLIVSGNWHGDKPNNSWSLNQLLSSYGAEILPEKVLHEENRWPLVQVDENWEIILQNDDKQPIYARRSWGKGRIVVLASSDLYRFSDKDTNQMEQKLDLLTQIVEWAGAGIPPAIGKPRLPTPMYGGGGIYQESELRLDGIVCYYSKNQTPKILSTVQKDFTSITNDLYKWIPSPKPEEPMYLVVCSGGGGGWAVNAYLPKEAGTISTSPEGMRSIFAHEQAHTMSGPGGMIANHPFGGNQGEEHAGWFQGKIDAKYNTILGPNRQCDQVFLPNYSSAETNPERIFRAENLQNWREGWDRLMIWYVWQKLDDCYGPIWYPRWRWVQAKRWIDTPDRKLSWDDSIEHLSIAVGEDLFPFFVSTGKKLNRTRCTSVEFQNETLNLAISPLKATPPGNACLGNIKDFTKPIRS